MSSAPCLYKDRDNKDFKCYQPVWAAGEGYCLKHKPEPWKGQTRKHSQKYIRNRKTVFAKYKNICQKCFKEPGAEVDHIIPVMDGGSDDLFNLTLLCIDCHQEKSEEENKRMIKELNTARKRSPQQ